MRKRILSLLLMMIVVLGLLPGTAFAASADTIKLEKFGMSGVSYESADLGKCILHQMYYDYGGTTAVGFCGTKGAGMGSSLIGQTWGNPREITDPTVKTMMAYYYAHSTGVFTDEAKAVGVDTIWDAGYTWYMNAWVQAIIWRHQAGTLSDPVVACAEELMAVYNSLENTNYTSIDQERDNASFRARAQYILDLGSRVWGDCTVYEYSFTGAGSSTHPASNVQKVVIGELEVEGTEEYYSLIVKKVDATNPTKGLAGAGFHIESTNGSYSKDVVTGSDGTCKLDGLTANTYAVTETSSPSGYEIDNAGPEYVVLPNNGSNTATITFTDTPVISGSGSIRKVDADNPTRGLAGAVIKIDGVDNNFTGTYVTVEGGALADVPWDTMPIGSYIATEKTPPSGYSLSPDPDKVKQEFYWDGKSDVALVFENDAKVKVRLLKLDASEKPLSGAVFNVIKDGQVIASEKTDASGAITVTNVTEGMYAFVEVSAPAPYAKLTEPVIVHVDQATVDGGGTISVTAKDQLLPNLTILKRDQQSKAVIPGTVFEVKGIHYGYHNDVTTGADGKAVLTGIPVDSYEVTEKSVPDPYVVGDEPTQTIWLGAGDDQQLIFDNLKKPLLTIAKVDAADPTTPIPGTTFTIKGIDSDYQHDVTTGTDGTVSLRVAPGAYEITEKSVPAPYYLPDKDADRVQTISLNAGDEKKLVFKDYKAPELTIYKEDSVAGAPVEGAKFHVTYTSNGEAADAPAVIDFGYILTDAQGEIKLHEQGQRLYPGEYTIEEVEPAAGFQIKEPSTQKMILHGGESRTATFQNVPLNAIIVEKYDSVSGEALPGCTFQLRFLGGTSGTGGTAIGQKITGKNGTAIWTGLTAGTYVLEELDPADGYSIIQSSETVYLADSGEQSVVTVRFENAPDGMLLIRKVCAVNPSVTLPDAEFKVAYADGTLIGDSNGIYRTDENGEIRITGLTPGKSVVVTETRAPLGYLISTQSQVIQTKAGRMVTLTFKDQPKGQLIIQKRDSATGQPLPGAEFRVTTAAGCEVGLDGVIGTSTLTQNGIFTTDANGEIHITNLAPGAYVLTEIKAPDGYVMDSPSTNVVIGDNGDTQTVVVKNSKAGCLVILKQDSLTGKPLEGVTFRVTTATGEFVPDENGRISSNGLYYTDKDGKITINGVVGTLVVTETKSIPGYTIDPATQTQTVVVYPNDTQTLRFYNDFEKSVVLQKYIYGSNNEPLAGVEFLVTDSTGAYVGPDNGRYVTDSAGRCVITGLTAGMTITAREVSTVSGYVLDGTPQTIEISDDDQVQTLYFYNKREGGLELIKVNEDDKSERIPNVTFEIRKMDGGLVDTITTDGQGRASVPLDAGDYYAVEIEAGEGFSVDSTPIYFTVEDGKITTKTVTNKAFSGIKIHKTDKSTGKGIYGVSFILYDAKQNPIGQYTSDNNGWVYISDLTESGRYYLRELENEGYVPDTQLKSVYVTAGSTTLVEWQNIPITAQIQIVKKSADYNSTNGLPAGTLLEGAVFEIYDKAGNLVDTIVSDSRGLAVSQPLPLGRYTIREVKAPANYGVNETELTAYLEHEGQIVRFEVTNKSLSTGVSITKTGPKEIMAGQPVRYVFSGIANTSNVRLDSFYFRDTLPAQVTLETVVTGTWNFSGAYKIVYKVNGTGDYRTLADNLSTAQSYTLAASPVALGLASNERVTEIMFVFGQAPAGFAQVETPYFYCTAVKGLAAGSSFVNVADAGGVYNGTWVQAVSRWVTNVYGKTAPLPRTGY